MTDAPVELLAQRTVPVQLRLEVSASFRAAGFSLNANSFREIRDQITDGGRLTLVTRSFPIEQWEE